MAEGRLSIEQAEQALAAVQANVVGHHGYLAADNVGVGKSRILALTVIELMERAKADGRPLRLLVTTKSNDNITDLIDKELLSAVLDDDDPGFEIVRVSDLKGAKKEGDEFEPLPQHEYAIYVVDSHNLSSYRPALIEVGLHGIIGDEVHRFKNSEAAVGATWQTLHANIFNTVTRDQQAFAYFTATPAQAVYDYQYLYGLRLWPIDGFHDWVQVVTGQANEETARRLQEDTERGGRDLDAVVENTTGNVVGGDSADTATQDQDQRGGREDIFSSRLTPSEAEQIPREWKMQGRFSSRDLWRDGTEFVIHEATMPPEAKARYDQFAQLARDLYDAARQFALLDKSGKASRYGVTGQLQFAAKRLQAQPAIEEAIRIAKREVASGHQVVLSLINVSEMNPTEGNIRAAIEKINTREIDKTPEGEIVEVGDIPEALIAKAELLEQAAALGVLDNPLDLVSKAFGADNVAFIVGGTGGAARQAQVAEFQAGKRTVAVLSAAGTTGISLDHRVETKTGAKGRRVFIDVQYEWSATEAIQRYGRVDRASQISPPRIIALTFGAASEKKFLATIANRMASLGALSRGGAESTGASALEEFEITGDDALQAARNTWEALDDDDKRLWKGRTFRDPSHPDLPSRTTRADMREINLALLWLPTDKANAFWADFLTARERIRSLQGYADARRTAAKRGEVQRAVDLSPMLRLFQVKNEEGHRFGILRGVVMPEMPVIREFLRDAEGTTHRRYINFTAGDEVISGLEVPITRLRSLAEHYGTAMAGEKVETPDQVRAALAAGDRIKLQQRGTDGGQWVLRQRQDGLIAIDGGKMADRDVILRHGGGYRQVGNVWVVQDLDTFIERFPVEQPKADVVVRDDLDEDDGSAPAMPRPQMMFPIPAAPAGKPSAPVTPKMRPSDIVRQLQDALGQIPVRTGHFRHQAQGIFKPDVREIRVRVANELHTIFHEAGHDLDITILKIGRKDPRWRDELMALGQATSRPSYKAWQVRKEGAAEFFRLFLMDAGRAQYAAPTYFAEFTTRLDAHPYLKKLLLSTRESFRGYESQDLPTRLKLRIDFDGRGEVGGFTKARTDPKGWMRDQAVAWVDDLIPLKEAVTQMRDGRDLDDRHNAYTLARIARGAAGKAQAFLELGVRARNGQFISGSLADALAPVAANLEDFAAYLVARRAVELKGRAIETGITEAEAVATIKQVQARADRATFETARDAVYAYQEATIEYARQYGALSKEQVLQMRKLNQAYVPFKRVMDDLDASWSGLSRKLANRSVPIRRIKGSGRDIINPLESIVINTHALVDMVEKNRAMIALTNQANEAKGSARWLTKIPAPQVPTKVNVMEVLEGVAGRDPAIADFIQATGVDDASIVTLFSPAFMAPQGQQIVSVIRDGKREFYQVNDAALYDAITRIGPHLKDGVMAAFFEPFTRLLRAGATLTPEFIARNPARDTLVAYMQSRYGFIPGVDTVRGLVGLLRGDADAKLFFTSGISQASLTGQDRDLVRQNLQGLTRQGQHQIAKYLVTHPLELLRALSSQMEAATRLGEFKLALDAAGVERGVLKRLFAGSTRTVTEETLTRATLAARDVTTDFSRGGQKAREWNRATAFFNARVQGYVRVYETVKRDPVGTLEHLAALGAFTAAVWFLNRDDEEYEELADWEKRTYWHLKIPGTPKGTPFIRIPKPFEWGYIPDVIEAGLDQWVDQDQDAWRTVQPSDSALARVVVSLVPTAILPMLEAYVNYSTFRGRPIVRPWDTDLPTEQQVSDYTSELAKQIATIIDVAPAKIDHVLFGYTAGLGRQTVGALDEGLGRLGLLPKPKDKPAKEFQHKSVIGVFGRARNFSGSAASIQQFYDQYQEMVGYDRGLKRAEESKDAAQLARLRDQARGKAWLTRVSALKAGFSAMRDLGDVMDAVYKASPEQMTPDEKRAALDSIRARMVDIARRATGKPGLKR